MTESQNSSKKKSGCWFYLLKVVIGLIIIYGFEVFGHWLISKSINDELSRSLIPFHNHYFSFSSCYLTESGIGSEFFTSPSSTMRFIIYGTLGLIMYSVASVVIALLPFIKKHSNRINSVLYYTVLSAVFVMAFFLPPKKTIIDDDKKIIAITRYNYLFFSVTGVLSFESIDDAGYEIITEYDGYNKQYIYYLSLYLKYAGGKKIRVGEIEVGKMNGTLTKKPSWKITEDIIAKGEKVSGLLKQRMGLNF